LKARFFGCGTSGGVPEIGCQCPVCTSPDPKNNRTRSSLLVETPKGNILIDTTPDFRTQALRERLSSLSAVLFTHGHADHLHGLDDIRPLTRTAPIPLYGNGPTIEEIRQKFGYFFNPPQKGGGVAQVSLHEVHQAPLLIQGIPITPLKIKHGILDILGYRIGDLAYVTDCSFIPEDTWPLLRDLEILVIGALRYRSHSTHFNINQALEVVERIRPKQTFFTHMTHDVEYHTLLRELPQGVRPAYDGLSIFF